MIATGASNEEGRKQKEGERVSVLIYANDQ